MSQANHEIRQAAKGAGLYLWEVAAALGLNDGNFSRKLRRELPPAQKEKILAIISTLRVEREESIS